MISEFHFIRPATLLLIPVAILLWLGWRRQTDSLRGWREQIDRELLSALIVGRQTAAARTTWVVLFAWLIGIVAVAGPTWKLEPSPFADDVAPLLLLLKADRTMETPDPEPSRMERARLKIVDIAAARQGLPLGLIAYSGSTHLVLPPTRDTDVVAQMAQEISPDIMPEAGDRLDQAIQMAQQILSDGDQGGSLLILADSVDVELSTLREIRSQLTVPVQFLAISRRDSTQYQSIQAAAKELNASVQLLSLDDQDVATVISQAARAPVAREGQEGTRWQESGYWLVPLVALFLLVTFRREQTGDET